MMMIPTRAIAFPLLLLALASGFGSTRNCQTSRGVTFENLSKAAEASLWIDQAAVDQLSPDNSTFTLFHCDEKFESGPQLRVDGMVAEGYLLPGNTTFSYSVTCNATFQGKACTSCTMCPNNVYDDSTTFYHSNFYYDCSDIDETYTCTKTGEEACDNNSAATGRLQKHESCLGGAEGGANTPTTSPVSSNSARTFSTLWTIITISGFMTYM